MKTLKNQKLHSLSLAIALSLSAVAYQSAYADDDDANSPATNNSTANNSATEKSYKKIGDLEIYQAAEQGVATLAMMVDVSRSMYAVDLDTPGNIGSMIMFETACLYDTAQTAGDAPPNETRYTVYKSNGALETADVFTSGFNTHYYPYNDQYGRQRTAWLGPNHVFYRLTKNHSGNNVAGQYWRTGAKVAKRPTNLTISVPITDSAGTQVSGKTVNFTIQACAETKDGKVEYKDGAIVGGKANRIGALKLGLISFLANGQLAEEKNRIAMGHFPSNGTGQSGGSMQVPANKLTAEHREKLIQYIIGLDPNGGTPVASAYAEAAAYLLGGTTNVAGAGDYSGFATSNNSTKDGNKYKSPFKGEKVSECAGNGIFFLTDGKPNLSSSYTPELMRQAFGKSVPQSNPRMTTNGTSSTDTSGWEYTGDFAKALLAKHEYSTTGFKTATVGFGGVFDSLTKEENQRKVTITSGKASKEETIPDCSKGSDQDVRNLCLLGELGGDYGRGGFTATDKPEGLRDALQKFFSELNNTVSATPSGTISIPKDPLNASTIQPYAYVPMMQPYVDKNNAIWDGNLKRYHTLYGTLYGQGNQRLYTISEKATEDTKDFPSGINPDARDLWQVGAGSGSAITVGGTRGVLAAQTQRAVYIEGKDSVGKAKMVKVQVDDGVLKIDNNQASADVVQDHGYTPEEMVYLADYLGYNINKDLGNNPTLQWKKFETNLKAATKRAGAFGGVAHSVPVLAAYNGVFSDQEGIDVDPVRGRNDFLIYGTTEGSLRMAKATDGQEKFAFIPRTILKQQKEALALGFERKEKDSPYFGVDAPWATSAVYDYEEKTENKKKSQSIKAKEMYAYGGLRMGGVGFYGLNISNPDAPELAFAISKGAKGQDFDRLGQTWAKPTIAKIKTNATSSGLQKDRLKDVLIFGGGYDMCYENPRFELNDAHNIANHVGDDVSNCVGKTHAEGNAIYMVDAKSGELLASWSSDSTAPGQASEMKHSIVSEIVALDRNNNGIVDSLYASDLGGQLFRIDLKEGVAPGSMTRRVVRVFNANEGVVTPLDPTKQLSANDIEKREIPFRFYEKPAVSFYDREKGGTVAMVNIASGDRSSPLHKHRHGAVPPKTDQSGKVTTPGKSAKNANRIYGIIDRDLTTPRIGQSGISQLKIQNLTHEHLHAYKHAEIQGSTKEDRKDWIDQLKDPNGKLGDGSQAIHGWWYPMTNFDTYTDVEHLKAIGSSIVVGGVFHTSIYSPEYQYINEDGCSAKIVGATERQMFCLPWGICADDSGEFTRGSQNGTLGFAKAGPGIQELAMATVTSRENTSTNFKAFIGQQTLAEVIADAKKEKTKPSTGANKAFQGDAIAQSGDGKESENVLTEPLIAESGRKLSVERWYDLANAESNQ